METSEASISMIDSKGMLDKEIVSMTRGLAPSDWRILDTSGPTIGMPERREMPAPQNTASSPRRRSSTTLSRNPAGFMELALYGIATGPWTLQYYPCL